MRPDDEDSSPDRRPDAGRSESTPRGRCLQVCGAHRAAVKPAEQENDQAAITQAHESVKLAAPDRRTVYVTPRAGT